VSRAEQQRPSYDELALLVARQAATIVELEAAVAELTAEVAELKRRLGSDSSNSSKPPSQDGLAKSKRSSGPSGGKRGKPFGARGVTKRLVDNPDSTVECVPARCGRCDTDLGGASEFSRQRRQVFELPPPPKVKVSEYRVVSLVCPCCTAVTVGEAPAGVSGRVQYGPGVKARLVYLRAAQYLPFGRAAVTMADLCGLPVSTGTIATVIGEAVTRLGPFLDRVRSLLRRSAVLGADETPAWVDGGWKYVHVACTETLTLLHAGNRSKAAIDAGGVLAGFTGVLVRDGYAGYDHIDTAIHAECGAHLLRALKGVHDGDPAAQVWAEYMANTLLIAKRMTEQAAAAGHTRLTAEQVRFIRCAYAGAIAAGRDANNAQPDTKAAKLVERFTRDAADILRFTTDTAVWFSNNQSERDLRPTKLQLKISGTWRTLQGLADFAALRSYLSTATKHGMDLLDILQQLFTTGPWLPPDPAAASS
jgi:transposase